MNDEYCNNCLHLSLTEDDQQNLHIHAVHKCLKHKKRVFHRGHHPNIVRLPICLKQNDKLVK